MAVHVWHSASIQPPLRTFPSTQYVHGATPFAPNFSTHLSTGYPQPPTWDERAEFGSIHVAFG